MTLTRVFLLDPHFTDEIYTPIRFHLRGRRGLHKYSYYSAPCNNDGSINIAFSAGLSGVIPENIFSRLPCGLRSLIMWIENKYWAKKNKLTFTNFFPTRGDSIIVFLRNCNSLVELQVERFRNEGVNIIWATSHFHLSYKNNNAVKINDLVLMDNKLDSNYKFSAKTIIFPPVVNEKFQVIRPNDFSKRDSRILCNGTIHVYRDAFSGSVKCGDFFTMHPSRYAVHQADSEILVKNFSIVTDSDTLYASQREYMNTNLTSLYNMFRFAFVGSEANGIVALGVYEAMACGCEVFIEKEVGDRVGLEDGKTAWFFDGTFESLHARHQEILNANISLDVSAIKLIVKSRRSQNLVNKLHELVLPINSIDKG